MGGESRFLAEDYPGRDLFEYREFINRFLLREVPINGESSQQEKAGKDKEPGQVNLRMWHVSF